MTKNINYYIIIGILFFFGLSYASMTLNTVPDYDELAYVKYVSIIQEYLNNFIQYGYKTSIYELPVAQTNTLNNYLVALVTLILPLSYATLLLNFSYILFTIYVLKKFFDSYFISIFLIFVASNFYFMHLLGTYISELSVGLLLVSVTVLTFFDKESKYSRLLIMSIILLLLSRTINLVFLAGTLGIVICIYLFDKNKVRIKQIFKSYFYAIILLSPILFITIKSQIMYIVANGTESGLAQNWRDMIGIESALDLPLYIINTSTYYNPYLLHVLFFVSLVFIFIYKNNINKLKEFLSIFLMICMVVFAFSNANSSNVMVIFWFYSLCALLLTYILFSVLVKLNNLLLNRVIYILGFVMLLVFSFVNYSNKSIYHDNRSEIYKISKEISTELNNFESNNLIAANYQGIGPLDVGSGLQVFEFNKLHENHFDKLGYDKDLSYYSEALSKSDILILANRNFLWEDYAKFINLDRYIENIYNEITSKKEEFGFYTYKRIYYKNDPERFFEILIKPQIKLNLPYDHIKGDKWLTLSNSINIFPKNIDLSSKQLYIKLEIPGLEGHKPPFKANLVDDTKKIIDSAVCNNVGICEMVFDLPNKNLSTLYFETNDIFSSKSADFSYRDWIIKPFSTKGTPDRIDKRKLTYFLKESKIIDKKIKYIDGIYSDNWVEENLSLKIYKTNKVSNIYGFIPEQASQILPIKLLIKGKNIDITKTIEDIGEFKIEIPKITQDDEIKINSDKSYKLSSQDSREVSWRFIKLEN